MKCFLLASTLVLPLLGCSHSSDTSASSTRIGPTYQGPAETAFCAAPISYADSVTVTGQATYNRREIWGNSSAGGLGSAQTSGVTHPASINPIRQAEVRVTDQSGAVVQCGVTSDSGQISLALPRGNTTYNLDVNSRALGTLLNVSVLNAPETNQFYTLRASVNASANVSGLNLNAVADGDTLGGAFNILDQLYNANIYLRSQVSNCSATFNGCRNVSTSQTLAKVVAYWSKGFNPNSYFGASSGLSFYLPGYSRLFILGGIDGDTDSSDTDHFDNSVIIHEYGHFMEDTVGHSDSPGGSHNGDRVIDPRLAWSEGWGDFIQAAVRNDDHYIDTIGNDDGSTELAYYTDLETAVSGFDYPAYQGEGNFQEFSVTRMMWDAIDTHVDTQFGATDNISGKFNEIWAAFSSATKGFTYGGYSFRNVGLLHEIQSYFQSTAGASDWSQIRLMERQDAVEDHYAQSVSTSGCSSGGLTVAGNHYYFATINNSIGFASDGGELEFSDLFRNNMFYRLTAPSGGTHQVTLRYQDADGAGQEVDLDLYVYGQSYTFGNTADMLGTSRQQPSGNVAAVETENTSLNTNAGANYLINISAYTGNQLGTQAYFNIYLDGSLLCPATTVQ